MTLKSGLRDVLPKQAQVPIKFWYSRLRGDTELELDLLPFLVSKDSIAVDVGANRGIYTYVLWRLGCHVEAFEPNPDCVAVLQSWAANKPRVHINQVALSDFDGQAQLTIPKDSSGTEHDSTASLNHRSGERCGRIVSVKTRRLDDYSHDRLDFIKIDVEGHETAVLKGAELTIRMNEPALLVEIERRHITVPIHEVLQLAQGKTHMGYFFLDSRLYPIEAFDVRILQRDIEQSPYINNFLFLPKSRLEGGAYDELMARYR